VILLTGKLTGNSTKIVGDRQYIEGFWWEKQAIDWKIPTELNREIIQAIRESVKRNRQWWGKHHALGEFSARVVERACVAFGTNQPWLSKLTRPTVWKLERF
jgi:hypothetical protein